MEMCLSHVSNWAIAGAVRGATGAEQPSRSTKQGVRTTRGPGTPCHRTQSARKETARFWFS